MEPEFKRFIGGAIVSTPQPEDLVAETLYAHRAINYPPQLDLRTFLQKVRDQHDTPTCVAHVGACIKEYQENKQIGFNEYMSIEFLYSNRESAADGMSGRDLMNILQTKGCCPESMCGLGDNVTPEARAEAAKYKIKNYAKVMTVEATKTSLVNNGPCYIGFMVYNFTDQFWVQRPGDKPLGAHAVTIVGYDASGFILRNSWGRDWANHGYTTYPYDRFSKHFEIWTTVDDSSPAYVAPPVNKHKKCCVVS